MAATFRLLHALARPRPLAAGPLRCTLGYSAWRGVHRQSAWTARRKVPPARCRPLPREGLGPRFQEQRKWALITLSGQTLASSGNDVWCGIAEVMGRVGANIEDAAGTSMPSPPPGAAAAVDPASPGLLVSAFRTHIAPFSLPLEPLAPLAPLVPLTEADPGAAGASGASGIAVAIVIKASMTESSVPTMTNLLHTRFPRLVCTVTVGGLTDGGGAETLEALAPPQQKVLTGTIRLFGIDQVGQLSRIAEVLHHGRVTILNLLVTVGVCDSETGDFVERVGGPLSENVISIAAFDQATFDEAALRREVEVGAHDVGYRITSIIFDSQELRAQELAGYYLRRKAFMLEVGQAETLLAPPGEPRSGG